MEEGGGGRVRWRDLSDMTLSEVKNGGVGGDSFVGDKGSESKGRRLGRTESRIERERSLEVTQKARPEQAQKSATLL